MLLEFHLNDTLLVLQATVGLSFLPDQNPRWEGYGLNTRMELMTEGMLCSLLSSF